MYNNGYSLPPSAFWASAHRHLTILSVSRVDAHPGYKLHVYLMYTASVNPSNCFWYTLGPGILQCYCNYYTLDSLLPKRNSSERWLLFWAEPTATFGLSPCHIKDNTVMKGFLDLCTICMLGRTLLGDNIPTLDNMNMQQVEVYTVNQLREALEWRQLYQPTQRKFH